MVNKVIRTSYIFEPLPSGETSYESTTLGECVSMSVYLLILPKPARRVFLKFYMMVKVLNPNISENIVF